MAWQQEVQTLCDPLPWPWPSSSEPKAYHLPIRFGQFTQKHHRPGGERQIQPQDTEVPDWDEKVRKHYLNLTEHDETAGGTVTPFTKLNIL